MSINSDHPPTNLNESPCDELRQLLPAYIIGATTSEETHLIQKYLPLCPDAASELELYATLAEGLTTRVEAVEPPPHLRKALLDRIAAEEGAMTLSHHKVLPFDMTQVNRQRRIAWGAVAAVLSLLLVTNAYWFVRVNTIEGDVGTLQQQKQTVITLLNAERLERISLQSTDNKATLARVFWNPETQNGIFYTSRIPMLDEDHTYQVWIIRGDMPISVGTFGIDASGEGLLTFRLDADLSSFAAIAISVEPTGGSPAPTTAPMALGEIVMS